MPTSGIRTAPWFELSCARAVLRGTRRLCASGRIRGGWWSPGVEGRKVRPSVRKFGSSPAFALTTGRFPFPYLRGRPARSRLRGVARRGAPLLLSGGVLFAQDPREVLGQRRLEL